MLKCKDMRSVALQKESNRTQAETLTWCELALPSISEPLREKAFARSARETDASTAAKTEGLSV